MVWVSLENKPTFCRVPGMIFEWHRWHFHHTNKDKAKTKGENRNQNTPFIESSNYVCGYKKKVKTECIGGIVGMGRQLWEGVSVLGQGSGQIPADASLQSSHEFGAAAKAGIRFPVVGQLQKRFYFGNYFLHFFSNREIRDTCILEDHISHIQSMVAKRDLTNRANVHTPMWKKVI